MSLAVTGQTRGTRPRRALRAGAAARTLSLVAYESFIEEVSVPVAARHSCFRRRRLIGRRHGQSVTASMPQILAPLPATRLKELRHHRGGQVEYSWRARLCGRLPGDCDKRRGSLRARPPSLDYLTFDTQGRWLQHLQVAEAREAACSFPLAGPRPPQGLGP